MLRHDVQIIDLLWIDPAAFGLAASAASNLENLLADAKTNFVLVRAESNIAEMLRTADRGDARIIAVCRPLRLLEREFWVLWISARTLLRSRDIVYTSWVPRLCLCVLLLPIKCRVIVHDLNIFRRRIYDADFRQPSWLSRLHQYLSIKRASLVQCFARSVARQLGLLRRDPIPVVGQTVRIVAPTPTERAGSNAVIFLDDRNYKGTWALKRFCSSTSGFRLTVIGRIDPANEKLLQSRGIVVEAIRPSNAEKFKRLAAADYVIFVSKYEGFGLPPREAAAVGTPALITRRAALLDIPAHLSLSIDRLGDRIDLAEIAQRAAQIDRGALKQWSAGFCGPVSTSWKPKRPLP